MTPGPPAALVPDEVWQRLSPRMLLVHPVKIAWSLAFPILLTAFGISRGSEGRGWVWFALAGAVLAVLAGVVSWLITRYRFTDQQLQLRTGLLSRKVTTAPLDRVRSVDIESSPVHRVLGLATVKVGTGVDSSRIELDGLTQQQAAELRTWLLVRSGVPGATATAAPVTDAAGDPLPAPGGTPYPGPVPVPAPVPGPPLPDREELARIDWGWLRYAPFSLSSLVVVAGAFGVLAQFQYIRLGRGSFAGKGLDLLFDVSPNLCPCFLCFGFLLIARAGPRRYAHQTEARRAYYTNRIMILPSHQRRLLR